jgi:hypothetical protein
MTKPVAKRRRIDFRTRRVRLAPSVFLLPEGQKRWPRPSDLVSRKVWNGIMHLPDHVALITSEHHGTELGLLYTLWADWIQVFEYDDRDELTDAMLDAGDCFQASVFDSLHGFYRSAISNLRSVIDVVAVGTLGKLSPKDDAYQKWTEGKSGSSLNFLNLRSRLSKVCVKPEERTLFKQDGWISALYEELCSFVHARPDSTDGAIWRSNGPIYVRAGFHIAVRLLTATYATAYLFCKIARPDLQMPETSKFIFGEDERSAGPTVRESALALGLVNAS